MYSIEQIAEIIKAKAFINEPYSNIAYLLTDSRRVAFPSSSLFFALRSPRRNGHDFIGDVYEQGVRSFVVEKDFDTKAFDANFLIVENTLKALQQLAAYHRSQYIYPVIGITGSNGKTIVKEWLYQLLSPDRNIIRSPRSYNSQIGVPLSVWQMNEQYHLAIFEAGISKRDEMQALAEIIQPTIGVLTNIGEAHKEGFDNIEQKSKEKFKLFDKAETVICNGDDPVIQQAISNDHLYKIFSWGREDKNDIVIASVNKNQHSTNINYSYKKEESFISIPFTDDASIQNAITCLCVMLYFKIKADVIQHRMQQLHAMEMRLQLVQAVNGSSLINDS
ncbi:MAG: Mur ligase family protein, partial [Ilyomonas sp.]